MDLEVRLSNIGGEGVREPLAIGEERHLRVMDRGVGHERGAVSVQAPPQAGPKDECGFGPNLAKISVPLAG